MKPIARRVNIHEGTEQGPHWLLLGPEDFYGHGFTHDALYSGEQVAALSAEVAALRKDAERYRRMRAKYAQDLCVHLYGGVPYKVSDWGQELDEWVDASGPAIDAAMLPLPEPYRPPNRCKCATCGAPCETFTVGAGNLFSPPVVTTGCKKCGNSQMIVEIRYDDPIAQYTAAQMHAHAAAAVAEAREQIARVFDARDKGVGGFYDPHEPAEIIRALGPNFEDTAG